MKDNVSNFRDDLKTLMNSFDMAKPAMIIFTEDNSFNSFLESFIGLMSENIQQAMDERDIKTDTLAINSIYRYLQTITQSLIAKIPDHYVMQALLKINILFGNWTRMLVENNLLKDFGIDNMDQINRQLSMISETIQGSLTYNRLIQVTEQLIKKAEQVLMSVPANISISENFRAALEKARE